MVLGCVPSTDTIGTMVHTVDDVFSLGLGLALFVEISLSVPQVDANSTGRCKLFQERLAANANCFKRVSQLM